MKDKKGEKMILSTEEYIEMRENFDEMTELLAKKDKEISILEQELKWYVNRVHELHAKIGELVFEKDKLSEQDEFDRIINHVLNGK